MDWKKFKQELDKAQNIAIVGHVRPDGDTIGSALALKRALESLDKRVLAFNSDIVPEKLQFLDTDNEIRKLEDATKEEVDFATNADITIGVDVSSRNQLGDCVSFFNTPLCGTKLIIDHHLVSDQIGDIRFIDTNADSAGSLVFDAIKSLGVELTKEIALPLFVAIASDTGWFRFNTVCSETLRRIAELVEAGVKVDEVYSLLNERDSLARFRLVGIANEHSKSFLGGKGVWSFLTQSDFEETGALMIDSKGIPAKPLSIADVDVSVLFIEQVDGFYRVELRSKGSSSFDCSSLAKRFEGGGHFHAAGISCLAYERRREVLVAIENSYCK